MSSKLNKKAILHEARDYAMVAAATLLYATAVVCFMLPYQITTGGVAGMSAIIYYATGLEVQYSYAAINLAFLILAARIVGLKFCIKTIWGFGMITVWLSVVQQIVQDPLELHPVDGCPGRSGWRSVMQDEAPLGQAGCIFSGEVGEIIAQ